MAPEAPRLWPSADFVLLIGTWDTRVPKKDRIALRSMRSFVGVPVPWPLTYETSSAARPASVSARRTARSGPLPVGSGAVAW
jgi:hypothetical protein